MVNRPSFSLAVLANLLEMKNENTAVFAGSFDPFTMGHLDVVSKAAKLFSEVIVLVANNSNKNGRFSVDTRLRLASLSVQHLENVRAETWDGLTVDFLRKNGMRWLVRGLRNSGDLEWERTISWNNAILYPSCETVFFQTSAEYMGISSTLVREILRYGGDISALVPISSYNALLESWRAS
jgi:pantetheine-phosphate adenylyltransferase